MKSLHSNQHALLLVLVLSWCSHGLANNVDSNDPSVPLSASHTYLRNQKKRQLQTNIFSHEEATRGKGSSTTTNGKGKGSHHTSIKSAKRCKSGKGKGGKGKGSSSSSSSNRLLKSTKTLHREPCPPDDEDDSPPPTTSPPPPLPTASPTTSMTPTSPVPSTAPSTYHPTTSHRPSAYDCASPTGRAFDASQTIAQLSGPILSPGSPQELASNWLTTVDTIDNCFGTMEQRYGLVVLYYALGGPSSWTNQDLWLSPETPTCEWELVKCDSEENVIELRLNDNGLVGSIPTEVSALTYLTKLRMFQNSLTGSVPNEVYLLPQLELLDVESNLLTGTIFNADLALASGTLKKFRCSDNLLVGSVDGAVLSSLTLLQELWFAGNSITGTIPTDIALLTDLTSWIAYDNFLVGDIPNGVSSLIDLEYLDLSNNGGLVGTIPSGIGQLTELTSLFISHTSVTGTIPSSVGNLVDLDHLDFQDNRLTGSIPMEFESLVRLTALDVSNNTLTGSLPSFGGYTQLDFLDLSQNQLSGQIPDDLFHDESTLRVAYFSNNTFSGTIPPSYVTLTTLEDVWFDGNELTGTIPSVTSDMLPNIEEILLDDNRLSGPVPDGYCILRATLLDENLEEQFRALHADCLPPEGSDVVQNPCDCCTDCTSGKGV